MNHTLIREANPSDAAHILSLIKELATFEREPEEVEVTVAELLRDGFGEHPKFRCFVAEVKQEIVGMALFYPCYSTWKGKSWHLEDLIVTESMRGKGVGFALLKEFIVFAQTSGVRRIQWVVLNWNTPAIDFYKKHGATVLEEWNITLMKEGAMKQFIAKHHAGI
ncbi:MAG: GNAT family N-acetyltransferase [Flavobacteriaceae bacterium]|jgi:GNAT superfamily N-acetyltransferase